MIPAIPQDQAYHRFADSRTLLGIGNAGDMLSNLAFLAVGVAGLALIWREYCAGSPRSFAIRKELHAYATLFAAVLLIAFGSTYYHAAPDDSRMLWDRLPMSLAFTALLAATITERIGLTVGLRMLIPLLAMGGASVAWWRLTGDLWPYVVVQYGSFLAILAIVIKFRSRYTHGHYIFGVLATYGAAKVAEALDAPIFMIGHILSGHTLKHLLAAAAVGCLIRMLSVRSPQ